MNHLEGGVNGLVRNLDGIADDLRSLTAEQATYLQNHDLSADFQDLQYEYYLLLKRILDGTEDISMEEEDEECDDLDNEEEDEDL
jgi:hypothetical protein